MKTIVMIKPNEFKNWHEYYWTYQFLLAERHIIPLLEKWGVALKGKRVLDVGCGDGGVTEAFSEHGALCTGVEIVPFPKRKTYGKVKYITGDIFDNSTIQQIIKTKFHIILCRDVLEHISAKDEFLSIMKKLMRKDGVLFFSFPPFYSPYGGHQQVFLKSKLKHLPYIHLIPKGLYFKFVSIFEKDNTTDLKKLFASSLSIRSFRRLISKNNLRILAHRLYFLRPSFEIRYGVKPLVAPISEKNILSEILVTGAYFLVCNR